LKKEEEADTNKMGRLEESKEKEELFLQYYKPECTRGWNVSPKLFGKITYSE
jgi:hypothetical protein